MVTAVLAHRRNPRLVCKLLVLQPQMHGIPTVVIWEPSLNLPLDVLLDVNEIAPAGARFSTIILHTKTNHQPLASDSGSSAAE